MSGPEPEATRGGEPAFGQGRDEIALDAVDPARAVLLGGEPFAEPLVLWWNFAGRSREDIDAAYGDWAADGERFGHVASPLPRTPVGAPHWHRG